MRKTAASQEVSSTFGGASESPDVCPNSRTKRLESRSVVPRSVQPMPTLKRRFRAVRAAFIFFSLLICICPSYATRDDGQRMVKVGATRLHMNVGGGGAAT